MIQRKRHARKMTHLVHLASLPPPPRHPGHASPWPTLAMSMLPPPIPSLMGPSELGGLTPPSQLQTPSSSAATAHLRWSITSRSLPQVAPPPSPPPPNHNYLIHNRCQIQGRIGLCPERGRAAPSGPSERIWKCVCVWGGGGGGQRTN